ncbi:hydroxymethylbilane synthase [Knoellia sp. p5-6-4]|uniref:hydroxymethylbilane synthase n=1 Tax=unclassified Knoellia TaxID=2618719 RepID=UPI0023DCBC74|nr:hydroxymethylbilane synthase [Knoellia sp. p5-6-4]MDF2144559.1 hydroxymethylbilane synthase [Knoellia sp. p5-6-4]
MTAPTTTPTLRLGTRRSALATTQSGWVADLLRARGHQVELVEIVTEGDVNAAPLTTLGGTGVFAAAIRKALLAGEVDLAVHSLKDLPTTPEPGLVVAAIPPREDPRDALVARDGLTLGELPAGSVVGTGSPRRVAQLAALGLGLVFKDVRGNVDTRIGLTRSGACDAVVLARAGLARLGRLDVVTETLDPLQMLPAPGQGALAVECRADDDALVALLRGIDDADTRACVTAERTVLAALEAGCSAPVGALAEVVEGEDGLELSLRAFVGSIDGATELRRSLVGPVEEPERLGTRLAAVLLEDGAEHLTGPEERPPAATHSHWDPDPAEATGATPPLAAPEDSRPEPTATERAT